MDKSICLLRPQHHPAASSEWFKSSDLKIRIADQSLSMGWRLPTEHFNFITGERVDLFDAPTFDELVEIIEEKHIDLLVLDCDSMRARSHEQAYQNAVNLLCNTVSTVVDVSFSAAAGPYGFSLDVDLAPDGIESITQPCGHTKTLAIKQKESMSTK